MLMTTWWSLAPLNSLWQHCVPGPWSSYRITAAGLLGYTPLVNRLNAAKGSRQTGHVPLEDVVAPEAKSLGPATGSISVGEIALCGGFGCCVGIDHSSWCCCAGGTLCKASRPIPLVVGVQLALVAGCNHPGVYIVAHLELLLCKGI